ncbi:hypothetical protein ACNKHT_10335 [Shigella flexneri]
MPAPRLLLVKKGSVYGPVAVMKRRWRAASITLILKIILRYRQNAPLDMYKEVNTGTNLPAQIDFYAVDGDDRNSSVSPKVVVRQTRRSLIRKPKRY